ncbi:hypothetical protein N8I77_002771 [Diaporthe amygdali]|uniref:Uncharacterized protein n=1 Tax=Phomopsis amygdali TaxID=1214568 RepID=A0AAD9STE2_PHOAM|nr:hypothetical protein N8I77_002771 [Diaporthe amygdali]
MASRLKKQINLRQTSPDCYTASWHQDWTVGSALHGGCVAALIHHVAATHIVTDPKLKAQNQPDILNLHLDFLRSCERLDSTITVAVLKTGGATSTLQLQLSQKGRLKVIALATSTNFDKSLGPTVPTDWTLSPPPKPKPDFDRILAHKPEENWIPAILDGEIIPITRSIVGLLPRAGHLVNGICDFWNIYTDNERMDATDIALMTDIIPSMSDTLMRNGGLYEAHEYHRRVLERVEKDPGVPALMTNSLAEGMQASTFNSTVTLDMMFTRRLPDEGLRSIFNRTATRVLQDGRMDVDVTICNEDMEPICISRQLILVLEAQRKFREGKSQPKI